MAKAEMNIKILTISEDELRKIINEEINKRQYMRPALPYVEPSILPNGPFGPNVVWCGTSIPSEEVMKNTKTYING